MALNLPASNVSKGVLTGTGGRGRRGKIASGAFPLALACRAPHAHPWRWASAVRGGTSRSYSPAASDLSVQLSCPTLSCLSCNFHTGPLVSCFSWVGALLIATKRESKAATPTSPL